MPPRSWPLWIVAAASLGFGLVRALDPATPGDFTLVVDWTTQVVGGVNPYTAGTETDYPPWALLTLSPLVLVSLSTSPVTVVLLSSVYPLLRAGLDVVIWLGAAWMFGVPLAQASLGVAVLVFVAAAVAMAGFGFASAAFAIVFKRGDPIVWFFGALSFLLSGVLYPTSRLPSALSGVSDWLRLTHALNGMRAALLDGATLAGVLPALATLAAFAVVGVPMGLVALAVAIRHARRKGTLGHV